MVAFDSRSGHVSVVLNDGLVGDFRLEFRHRLDEHRFEHPGTNETILKVTPLVMSSSFSFLFHRGLKFAAHSLNLNFFL